MHLFSNIREKRYIMIIMRYECTSRGLNPLASCDVCMAPVGHFLSHGAYLAFPGTLGPGTE